MSTPLRSITLALYRDPALLDCVERPGFAGGPPTVIIELSLHGRLRQMYDRGDPAARRFAAPVLFAPTWRRTVPSLLQLAAEEHPEAQGPVVLLCHTLDARFFIDSLGPVSATRLIWHPADRADHRLSELAGRLQRSALGPSLTSGGLYLSSASRPATAEQWQRTVTCPTLAGLSRLPRRPLVRQQPQLRVSA